MNNVLKNQNGQRLVQLYSNFKRDPPYLFNCPELTSKFPNRLKLLKLNDSNKESQLPNETKTEAQEVSDAFMLDGGVRPNFRSTIRAGCLQRIRTNQQGRSHHDCGFCGKDQCPK